jgi:hypothetical protein
MFNSKKPDTKPSTPVDNWSCAPDGEPTEADCLREQVACVVAANNSRVERLAAKVVAAAVRSAWGTAKYEGTSTYVFFKIPNAFNGRMQNLLLETIKEALTAKGFKVGSIIRENADRVNIHFSWDRP